MRYDGNGVPMNEWQIESVDFYHAIRAASVGDVLRGPDGKRYQVTKKTATAFAYVQYRWYHTAADWILAKVNKA